MTVRTTVCLFAFWSFLLAGCDRSKSASSKTVVVYCSVDTAFAEPILAEFEKRSGFTVHRIFDTEAGKTTGLVNKLLAERQSPRADVWWSGEIFGTMQLASRGVLAEFRPSAAVDVPERYRDPNGRWTAIGLRGRVIAYDPRRIKKDDLPKRWCDLADPKYKGRFCMADPRFGTTRGHMATLLSLWGRPAMEKFFRELKANDCRLTDGNSQSVLRVARGMNDFAATDTDDVLSAQQQGGSVAMIYPDLDAPDGVKKTPGTLWIPSSIALIEGAPHPDAGQLLVNYLILPEVEQKLHDSDSKNVPVRTELRNLLKASAPGEAVVDYAAAAAQLDLSDTLVRDILLQ